MHPVLFELPVPGIGPVAITSYGAMLGTSMVLAWFIVMWIGERNGMRREPLGTAFIVTALSAIAGARAVYVVTNPHEIEAWIDLLDLRGGGLVAYGGFVGGFAGAFMYVRAQRDAFSFLELADVTAPALALGLSVGRVGCYLYGCDYGSPLAEDAPGWLRALGTFPHWDNDQGSPAWAHHVATLRLPFDAEHSYPVHPTQLYESALGLVLLGMTLYLWWNRQFRGQVLLCLAVCYGICRFFLEYFRDDPERGQLFGLSTSQLFSLAVVPLAAFAYNEARKRQRAQPARVMRLGDARTFTFAPQS